MERLALRKIIDVRALEGWRPSYRSLPNGQMARLRAANEQTKIEADGGFEAYIKKECPTPDTVELSPIPPIRDRLIMP